ncbi:OmpA family protein [Candidatus Ichthyocystis hellenicum]|nr:OmpA family protein [Candidatus Ichthyocystis hellenicum]
MMRVKLTYSTAFALGSLLFLIFSSFGALALTGSQDGAYVRDGASRPVRDAGSNCVRASSWSPLGRTPDCDPEYFKKSESTAMSTHDEPAAEAKVIYKKPVVPPSRSQERVIDHKLTLSASTFFDTSSSMIRGSSHRVLDGLVDFLKQVKIEVVVVTGYTDSRGSDALNTKLSRDRANAVRKYLIKKGIDHSSIYAEGKSKSDPVATNMTEDGRSRNRRVQVEIIGVTSVDPKSINRNSFIDNHRTKDSAHIKGN